MCISSEQGLRSRYYYQAHEDDVTNPFFTSEQQERQVSGKTIAPIEAWKCVFPPLVGHYERQIKQTTSQRTDMRVQGAVSFHYDEPITVETME